MVFLIDFLKPNILNISKETKITECERLIDVNFFCVGIWTVQLEYEISSLDKPDASGPNIKPTFLFFCFFTKFKNWIREICFLSISLFLAVKEKTTSKLLTASERLLKTFAFFII